jgi:hypothetical protein
MDLDDEIGAKGSIFGAAARDELGDIEMEMYE